MKNLVLFLMLGLVACSSVSKKQLPSSTGLDAELTTYAYPFPVKFHQFRAQGQDLKMAYMDLSPEAEAKKTIVLFHGKNFSGYYFDHLAHKLLAAGYRVIIIDQVGFGKSSKPAHFQYSFQAMSEFTKALLDQTGVSKFVLFGHSMGGMLATRFALMFPDQIEKLFLVDAIGLEDWRTMTAYRGIDALYEGEKSGTREKLKTYQLEHYYDQKWKPEYDRYLEVPTGWQQGPDRDLMAWTAALTSDMVFTQPVYYEFRLLKPMTVLINGTKDKTAIGKAWATEPMKSKMGNYKKMGTDVAAKIPRSKLIALEGMGHTPFIEDLERFWAVFAKELP